MEYLFHTGNIETEYEGLEERLDEDLIRIKEMDHVDAPEGATVLEVQAYIKGLQDDFFCFELQYGTTDQWHHFIPLGDEMHISSKDLYQEREE